nr:zf-CCHC domain-containing protein/UBN2 domain-containing protein [Tanacetum cinerariifolium]
ESIDSSFARFNTIITSLKALDEGFSSKNYVRKFLMALHPKWIAKRQKERVKSVALKAKKDSSDDETLTSKSDDEEYAMAVRNFKKFFRRKGKFVRCGDPNHLIGDRPKPPCNKDQKAFIRGSCSDSGNDVEDKTNMKLVSWLNHQMSANSLREMLNNQKSSRYKIGLGSDSSKASTSKTKPINFVGSSAEIAPDGSTIKARIYHTWICGFVK